ncbi:caldesmon-like [Camellia sinensis]|uniref:caldesmon-like n=1 Tax=Camellia sinensis TaxID=4442 RepID=UPI001036C581|nr:caldesmon-like [Camellia sinensis]
MTVDEFFACYKASGQQETWVTLQAAAGKGLVAGLPSSIKGWRPRWFYVSASGGVGVRTIWKVPTKSVEPKLGAAAEERIKRVKEQANKEGEALKKKKKKSALEGTADAPGSKKAKVGGEDTPMVKEVEKGAVQETLGRVAVQEVVEVTPALKVVEVAPAVVEIASGVAKVAREVQAESGATGPEPRGGEQSQGGFAPQGGGVDEAKAQLVRLKKESVNWKSTHAELRAVKLELENEHRQVVLLEFQLAGEQKKLGKAQKACAVALERHLQKELEEERAKASAERAGVQRKLAEERAKAASERATLQKQLEEERAKVASERATLQKDLDKERAKVASERAAYPDLCVVAVDQFKGPVEFQMAVDAAVTSSLAREESWGAGPSRTTTGGRTESEVIESFQRSSKLEVDPIIHQVRSQGEDSRRESLLSDDCLLQ